jgi:hypothetical protein
MQITKFLINEKVTFAKTALNNATVEDVIDRCLEHLKTLRDYRDQLLTIRESPEIDIRNQSSFALEVVTQSRASVREAIEMTVKETNHTNNLLRSFTSISIHEAAEIFNTMRYEGSDNWEVSPVGLRFSNGFVSGFTPTAQAIETASLFRREAYVLLHRQTGSTEKIPT